MSVPTSSINFGSVNTSALAEYFIRRYNLVGRDAEYTKNNPTLGMIPRDTEKLKQGDSFFETLKVGSGWSGSPDWVEGNKNHTPSNKVRWQVSDPFATYARIPFDTLALNRSPLGTLLDIKGAETDDVRDNMLRQCEFELWQDGSGARGKISAVSGTTTFTMTLTGTNDAFQFEYGQILSANTAADGSGTARANRYKVTDFDPINNKVVGTRTVDATDPFQVNDFVHVVGSANKYMPGIPTFIPASAPSDTIYGVARTANPALSGWRFSFKNSISETIQRAFTKMGQWVNQAAGKFVVVLSPLDWLLLSMERESRVIPDPGAFQKWGTSGLGVVTPFGMITCIAIPSVADGRGYIIDWTSWRLYTLKNLPHVVDEDGLTFLRGGISTPDGYQHGDLIALQMRMWKVLLCLKPMSNATFPTS